MSGIFSDGVAEVRPGSYFLVGTDDSAGIAQAQDGIAAVLFKGAYGPLNEVRELTESSGIAPLYGNGGNVDALELAFLGGAKTVLAVRVGSGGTAATTKLGGVAAITARYPGSRSFSVSVKDSLTEENAKTVAFYAGNRVIESYSVAKDGSTEGAALKAAMERSGNFTVAVDTDGQLPDISQQAFTPGTDPTVDVESYSAALEKLEASYCNVICVDTEEHAVHLLVKAFQDRAYRAGFFSCAVVAADSEKTLEERMALAGAFRDEKMVYVLNAKGRRSEAPLTGYRIAAIVAGMYASCPSNQTLTHRILRGVTELMELLKPSDMIRAEKQGCLVLSKSPEGSVWIDNAINTLVEPGEGQDTGWKKIRRTKTRFELMYRMNVTADSLVGKVDNDKNGRETVIANLNEVGAAMVREGKLVSCRVTEHPSKEANADYAYFLIDTVDKDSLEHLYLYYNFSYDTSEEG